MAKLNKITEHGYNLLYLFSEIAKEDEKRYQKYQKRKEKYKEQLSFFPARKMKKFLKIYSPEDYMCRARRVYKKKLSKIKKQKQEENWLPVLATSVQDPDFRDLI